MEKQLQDMYNLYIRQSDNAHRNAQMLSWSPVMHTLWMMTSKNYEKSAQLLASSASKAGIRIITRETLRQQVIAEQFNNILKNVAV